MCIHNLLISTGDGVNFVYSQDETSEMFIGEWAESRGIRDQLIIATKVVYMPWFLTMTDTFPRIVHWSI